MIDYKNTFKGWFFKNYDGQMEFDFPEIYMFDEYVRSQYEEYCKEQGIEPKYNY